MRAGIMIAAILFIPGLLVASGEPASAADDKTALGNRYYKGPLRKDNTTLFQAARAGNSKAIEKLVKTGYDVTATDKNGATPLCIAIQHRHDATAQRLLSFGSDMNHKDHNGRTPLHYAALYNQKNITHVLLLSGAERHARDKQGKTPRDLAVEKGHKTIVDYLDTEKFRKIIH